MLSTSMVFVTLNDWTLWKCAVNFRTLDILLCRSWFSSIDEAEGDCGGVENEVKSEAAESGGLNWNEEGETMRILSGLNCGGCERL